MALPTPAKGKKLALLLVPVILVVATVLVFFAWKDQRSNAQAIIDPRNRQPDALPSIALPDERSALRTRVDVEHGADTVVDPGSVGGDEVGSPPADPVTWHSGFPQVFERDRLPDETFRAKYEDMSMSELAGVKATLNMELGHLRMAIADDLFTAGIYEEYFAEPTESLDDPMNVPPWPPHEGFTEVQRTETLPDGRLHIKRTIIPAYMFPDYYAKLDEAYYVVGLLNQ